MFKKILAPVDGSEQSGRALELAVDLAGKYGGRVMILCVYRHHSPLEASLSMVRPATPQSPDDALKTYATEIVKEAKDRAAAAGKVPVEGFVRRGQPARTIVSFAEEHGADAIVLGSRGAGDISGYLLGSVSHKVAGLAKVTCVTVK